MVLSTAIAKAEETARAAVLVARAVAAAAVASTTAAAAAAMEDEVLDAALALEGVTSETARELAADTVERRAARALAAREAVAATVAPTERLREANRQLRRAGARDRIVGAALGDAPPPDTNDVQSAARYLDVVEQDRGDGDGEGVGQADLEIVGGAADSRLLIAVSLETGGPYGRVVGQDRDEALDQLRSIAELYDMQR